MSPRLTQTLSFLITTLAALSLSSAAAAQAPPAGLYEAYSPITMTPVGALTPAQARALPVHLDARRRGANTIVVRFAPEDRVRWTLNYGPHGLKKKEVRVDGELWATSRFTYSAAGALLEKSVKGRAGKAKYTYDHTGDVTIRTPGSPEDITWTRKKRRAGFQTKVTSAGAVLVRQDRYDAEGRLLESKLGSEGRARIVYKRDGAGHIKRVISHLPGLKPWTWRPKTRRTDVASVHLSRLRFPLERVEVQYLLGEPVTARDDAKGLARTVRDSYAEGCWMNAKSSVEYGPTGALTGTSTDCICGFCVEQPPSLLEGDRYLGADTHWTAGPWVRIDDALTVTTEHRLVTPSGLVAAGDLRVGDAVLGADGTERVIKRIEPVTDGVERRGYNLRTARGRFEAGGFLLESERGRPCARPAP